ncbi:ANTAR domain-containing protein [Nocardioides aurantiacus]|uniref:ANTAR domain-containing protein n=1 Tax=Nocardioides aurantiacus TaxID=86796 RepID=UPI001FE8579D|nr:ANTAR domain-containing protein [Nocardioides aurantiacus]
MNKVHHLEVALERRTVIGQATGIAMERYQLTPEVAMAVLRRLSQATNHKLHDIATDLVGTSILPPGAAEACEQAGTDVASSADP